MRRWLLHPWVDRLARLVLGLVFIAAAVPKIVDPPAFAKAVWAYDLFPAWSVNSLALGLPWLELLCGLALCVGFWIRAATAWTTVLLLAFGLALTINLARQHPVDCGCFGATAPKTQSERLADMRWSLLRDAGLLLLAAQVLLSTSSKARRPSD